MMLAAKSMGLFPQSLTRHCEERSDEAIQQLCPDSGLLRGACHRAALRADPLARNEDLNSLSRPFWPQDDTIARRARDRDKGSSCIFQRIDRTRLDRERLQMPARETGNQFSEHRASRDGRQPQRVDADI